MMRSTLIYLVAGVVSLATLANGNLFPTVMSTVTVTATATTTTTLTVSPICASLVNVTGQCRRRRSVQEQPIVLLLSDDEDDISPSFINIGEETTSAQVSPPSDDPRPPVESSHEVAVETLGQDSSRIQDARLNFFMTIFNTTTLTRTLTATTSVTRVSTATFFISRCTPSPFSFAVCN